MFEQNKNELKELKKSKWIFLNIFKKKERYEPIPPDFIDTELAEVKENRYYFHNNKLIRWLDENKRQVSKNDPQFSQAQRNILNDSNNYILKAKSK